MAQTPDHSLKLRANFLFISISDQFKRERERERANTEHVFLSEMSVEAAECGNLTEEYHTVWKSYEFWCEGVLFSSLGIFGTSSVNIQLNQ